MDEKIGKKVGEVKRGRRRKYNSKFPKKAYELALKGYTDKQIAEALGIAVSVFYAYQNTYSEFKEALKRGKEPVDNEVENKLLKRALGYDVEERITEVKMGEDGQPKPALVRTVKKHVAPDVTAQIFWLKNRKPAEWRDKHELASTHSLKKDNTVGKISDDVLFKIADSIQDDLKENEEDDKKK